MLVVLVYSNSSSAPKRASSTVLRASSLSDQGDAAADQGEQDQAAEPALALLRLLQALGGLAQALGGLAQFLLDLLVAGHGLDRALAVAGRAAVGAAWRTRRRRAGCRAALRPRSGAARRGSRGRPRRGRRRGPRSGRLLALGHASLLAGSRQVPRRQDIPANAAGHAPASGADQPGPMPSSSTPVVRKLSGALRSRAQPQRRQARARQRVAADQRGGRCLRSATWRKPGPSRPARRRRRSPVGDEVDFVDQPVVAFGRPHLDRAGREVVAQRRLARASR